MAWTLLPSVSTRYEGLTLRITKAGYDGPYLIIRIPRALAAESGIPADVKSRAAIFVGSGSDAGRMKIEPRPNGARRCQPVGKIGPVKIAFPKPPGAPDDFATTMVEATVVAVAAAGSPAEGRGLTFVLPWYRPAADREVELVEEDQASLPTAADVRGILTPTIARTLDTIEEAARPAEKITNGLKETVAVACGEAEPARTRVVNVEAMKEALEELGDKPVNGSAKRHVYADSDPQKFTFTHNGKSCQVNKRQHILLTKLHEAMVKNPDGFLDDGPLVKATGVPNADSLHALVSTGRHVVAEADMDLHIKRWPKLGYYMREVKS